MKTFDARIGNLTNENAFLRILVNNATDHANNLKKLSDFLQSLLRDPNKYAEKALRAAEAYGNIVKAIEEVLKLAREANANSKIALDLVSLFFSSRDGLHNNVFEPSKRPFFAHCTMYLINETD